MNTFRLLLLEVLKKCKEPSVARKEKIKIPIVGCTMRSGYVMGDEFHPLLNQQASMAKCDPKKKPSVGEQNFLGSTKQLNKHCSHSFSEIYSPPKEQKKRNMLLSMEMKIEVFSLLKVPLLLNSQEIIVLLKLIQEKNYPHRQLFMLPMNHCLKMILML
jgi:hypothetical protein